MLATVVIPARFGSIRFPAKILATETGRPLVQHVVDRVRLCERVGEVIVATDDVRIADALKPYGTRTVMTSAAHPSGTDRIAEVMRGSPAEVVVNVQGDEPEIEPGIVDGLIEHMFSPAGRSTEMATAATAFPAGADIADPNLVKVVRDATGRALYFSRAPIPFARDGGGVKPLLHLGIYAYRVPFLLRFTGWPPTPLEQTEKLEQLRALEHGVAIHVMTVARASHGIDTPEQYAAFVRRYRSNTVHEGVSAGQTAPPALLAN